MTLSYSRDPFCCFTTSTDMATFWACHRAAFAHFGGVPGVIVYDRTKTIVKRHVAPGLAVPLHPEVVAFAEHYGFEIDVLAAYRPTGKGRVERQVVIVREHVLAGRVFEAISQMEHRVRSSAPLVSCSFALRKPRVRRFRPGPRSGTSISNRRSDSGRDGFRRLVLPEAHDLPAGRFQHQRRFDVTVAIGLDLAQPVVGVVLERRATVLGAAMPEAAVDEDGDSLPGEDNVSAASQARHGPDSDPVPEPLSMK